MSKMLRLPNGNLINPEMIGAVKKVPARGVVILDANNGFADFIEEPDADRQALILMALDDVLTGGRSWHQPNWDAILPGGTAPASKPVAVKADKAA